MHPLRKQRLFTVLFIVIASSTVIALMLYAARESINLFYPPSKIVDGEAPVGRNIKAGGCVVPGSVVRSDKSLQIDFDITDGRATISVVYEGILPDLFAEGEAAVVDGKLDADFKLHATRVLAKHDENYTPAEVSENLQASEESAGYKGQGAEHVKTCESVSYDS